MSPEELRQRKFQWHRR